MPYVHFWGWLVEYSCLNMCPAAKTADSTGSTDSVLVSNTQSSEHQKFSTKVISVQLYVSMRHAYAMVQLCCSSVAGIRGIDLDLC